MAMESKSMTYGKSAAVMGGQESAVCPAAWPLISIANKKNKK
jgi:hypothetical protein